MKLKCACVVGVIGAGVLSASAARTGQPDSSRGDRQVYPAYSNNKLNDKYNDQASSNYDAAASGGNINYNDLTNYLNQQQQYDGYYDGVSSAADYYTNDPYGQASSSSSAAADSSPALSALALLGFLYFLNLIQNVLDDTGGRRRRDISSSQNLTNIDPEKNPLSEEDLRSPKFMSYLEDFFIQLPYTLGLTDKAQKIDRNGREQPEPGEASQGILGMVRSRLGMISSIMDFLKDPRPSRVKRDAEDVVDSQGGWGIWYSIAERTAEFTEDLSSTIRQAVSDIDAKTIMTFLSTMLEPSPLEEKVINRTRRYTDQMNVWYDRLGGRNAKSSASPKEIMHSSGNVGNVAGMLGKFLMMMNDHSSKMNEIPNTKPVGG